MSYHLISNYFKFSTLFKSNFFFNALQSDNKNFEYFEEVPLGLIDDFEHVTGKALKRFVIVNYEYGPDFSGPGKDVFKLGRAVGNIENADESNFLHPVFYYFETNPKIPEKKSNNDILIYADAVHHIIEDFTTFWTDIKKHRLHLRRFFEAILDTDLREFDMQMCAKLFLKYASFPITCQKYFD